jgi:NTE family protein
VPGILTGVSAGGLIATHLAARRGTMLDAIEELSRIWRGICIDDVFRVTTGDLSTQVARWGLRLLSGGSGGAPRPRSLVDTEPLRQLLTLTLEADTEGVIPGIQRNLDRGALCAIAITASSYTTGQSVTWLQGGREIDALSWDEPQRRSHVGALRIDHVLASSALPLFFPAVEVDGAWYGDGGIRLTAPFSPAVHLGARTIVAVSTRYPRTRDEANMPSVLGYPPPAQVAGVLMNAIFLDLLDADALRLQQVNSLIDRLPANARTGLHRVNLLVLRPSQDLGRLANEFEAALPKPFRFLLRGLGSRETRSNDLLSLLMFQSDYVSRLIELGEEDARDRDAEIAAILND